MGQRLKELSQGWADLAARGIQMQGEAAIRKNERTRASIQQIGQAISSAIVRVKGQQRQDAQQAHEEGREDMIREERYGREDARNTVEDNRAAMRDQFQRDVTVHGMLNQERQQIIAGLDGATPDVMARSMERIRQIDEIQAQTGQRIIGGIRDAAQQQAGRLPEGYWDKVDSMVQGGAKGYPLGQAAPPADRAKDSAMPDTSVRPAGGATGPAMDTRNGSMMRVPRSGLLDNMPGGPVRDVDARGGPALQNMPGGPIQAAPVGRAGESAPATPEANLPAMTTEERNAFNAQREASDLRLRQQYLNERATKLRERAANAKTHGSASYPQLLAEANAASDAALDAASRGKLKEQEYGMWKSRAEQNAKINEEARRSRVLVRTAGEQAGLSEDEIIGYEAKATSLDAARLLAAGMKPKAAALTPEQRGRNAAAETIAREDALKAAGRGKPVKPVVDGEAKWQADQSASALKKYEAQTRVYGDTPQVVRWDTFTTDELTAGMNDGSVAPDVRAQFRAEFVKRNAQDDARLNAERAIRDSERANQNSTAAIRSVTPRNPFAGGGSAPTAPAPGGSDPKARASAEFDALPEAQQTRDAWVAIKRKHGL